MLHKYPLLYVYCLKSCFEGGWGPWMMITNKEGLYLSSWLTMTRFWIDTLFFNEMSHYYQHPLPLHRESLNWQRCPIESLSLLLLLLLILRGVKPNETGGGNVVVIMGGVSKNKTACMTGWFILKMIIGMLCIILQLLVEGESDTCSQNIENHWHTHFARWDN